MIPYEFLKAGRQNLCTPETGEGREQRLHLRLSSLEGTSLL